MAYVTRSRLETAIPPAHLRDALDDDRDGAEDPQLLDEVIASASNAVDAFLAGLFPVPFVDPAPAAVAEAAFVLACERIYDRRGAGGENPWRKRADDWRGRLAEIGQGKRPLDAGRERSFTPGAMVVSRMSVDGTMT